MGTSLTNGNGECRLTTSDREMPAARPLASRHSAIVNRRPVRDLPSSSDSQEVRPMLRRLVLATAMVLLPALLFAQAERKDFQVAQDVSTQVLRYTRFTVFDDVNIAADHGVVTLSGRVTMPYKADDLARIAGRVAGVTQVKNEIKVLPVSPFDDDLRYRIARAIYGNPAFWQYAAMANPPIHIVVENGHVTLTGVVNNNVERMMAQSIASSSVAFSVSNKLRTDAEAKADLEKLN
jgi:hyperosmotically inducible periplasmic protein